MQWLLTECRAGESAVKQRLPLSWEFCEDPSAVDSPPTWLALPDWGLHCAFGLQAASGNVGP